MSKTKNINPDIAFWSLEKQAAIALLNSSENGLTSDEAKFRNTNHKQKRIHPFVKDAILFFSQFKNPLILLLVFGLILSSWLGEYTNATIIFSILFLSGVLGFVQERNAGGRRLRNYGV